MTEEKSANRPFQIFLFGGPRLLKWNEPCPLSPLQGALIGVLFGSDQNQVEREEIISLLWPEGDPQRSRRCLNQLLYATKKKLGSPTPFESLGDQVLIFTVLHVRYWDLVGGHHRGVA